MVFGPDLSINMVNSLLLLINIRRTARFRIFFLKKAAPLQKIDRIPASFIARFSGPASKAGAPAMLSLIQATV